MLRQLLDLREIIGGFRSDIRILFERADEDRGEREREHKENQQALANLSIKLDQHASEVKALQARAILPCARIGCPDRISPPAGNRMAVYATVGIGTAGLLVWAIQKALSLGISWLLDHVKFGG